MKTISFILLVILMAFSSACVSKTYIESRIDYLEWQQTEVKEQLKDLSEEQEELYYNYVALLRFMRMACEEVYDPERCAREFPEFY
jgi:L-asparagine transporter-like permease